MFKSNKKILILAAALAAALIALSLLKNNEYISEYIFARGISRWYISVIGSVSSLLPFSLYELLLTAAIIWLAFYIVKLIKLLRKKDRVFAFKKTLRLACVILSAALLYNMTASFCYSRYPLDLNLYDENPESGSVYLAAEHFLKDFNLLADSFERDSKGNIIPPYNFGGLSEKLKSEYKRLHNGYLNPFTPSAKPMVYSEIMSYMGFSGVFMSLTGEANININIPPKDLPLVTAHELAHSAGIMRENEANLTAYYLLLTSSDGYLRYSGYCGTFSQMLSAVYYSCGNEKYGQLVSLYNPKIKKESQNAAEFWAGYKSFFEDISDFFNDVYLKISGVPQGSGSYQNPYDVTDTGKKDNQGNPVYDIKYSAVQKIYFTLYHELAV